MTKRKAERAEAVTTCLIPAYWDIEARRPIHPLKIIDDSE